MIGMTQRTIDFGPLRVTFDERVLEPRPWTLLQAEWAAELAPALPEGMILELCSGAGHIGQAAAVLASRDLVQVDVDPHACALAEANAVVNAHHLGVDVRCGDLDDVLGPDERFPLVLADPPYLPSHEVGQWRDDPRGAIDGGDDGLALPRRCLATAAAHVAPAGVVLLQALGEGQLDALADAIAGAGLERTATRAVDERRAVGLLQPVART
jgi:release factor glutamine methyltransferase